jgi:two-component system CheB/CheR fusion protein
VLVRCDIVRLQQIIWNLLSNAIKFTPDGGKVSVRLEVDAEAERCRLSVTDSGKGIDPQFLPHVFEMFSQGGGSHDARERGLGIGLALVRELVEAHGGEVRATSEGLGHGASFVVRLPLVNPERERTAATNTNGNILAGMRILLVDDSKETLSLFKDLLEMEEARVDIASSGAIALEKLESSSEYDLLISDIGMPQMNGYQLIAKVRSLPGVGGIRALALTGYGRDVDGGRASSAGFDGHLPKPTSVEDLKNLLASLQPAANS